MFGFYFGGAKIDSRGVKLISFKIDSNLNLEFEAFNSIIDF